MRTLCLACGTLVLSALSLTAHATPISFTETVTGSGSLGSSFSSKLVTISGTGDTSSVTLFAPGIYILSLNSVTVQVGAGPVATFTGGIYAFDNQNFPGAGLSQVVPPLGDILDTSGSAFITYALNASISAIGNTTINQGDLFPTSAGSFEFTSFDSVTTFTANLAPVTTPEPSSLSLLGTGLLGLAEAARRRYRGARSL